jgi:hypothetical protein
MYTIVWSNGVLEQWSNDKLKITIPLNIELFE